MAISKRAKRIGIGGLAVTGLLAGALLLSKGNSSRKARTATAEMLRKPKAASENARMLPSVANFGLAKTSQREESETEKRELIKKIYQLNQNRMRMPIDQHFNLAFEIDKRFTEEEVEDIVRSVHPLLGEMILQN